MSWWSARVALVVLGVALAVVALGLDGPFDVLLLCGGAALALPPCGQWLAERRTRSHR